MALGVSLFSVPSVAFNIGLQHLEASQAAVGIAALPLWSVLLGAAFLREGLSRRQILGVFVAATGTIVAISDGFTHSKTAASWHDLVLGYGCLLVAAAGGAVYGLMVGRALQRNGPLTVIVYAMTLGAAVLVPIAVVEPGSDVNALVRNWPVLLFLAVPCAAVAFSLWTVSLARLKPTQVAVYSSIDPLAAAALGILLLGERQGPLFFIGLLLVIGGVVMTNLHAQTDATGGP